MKKLIILIGLFFLFTIAKSQDSTNAEKNYVLKIDKYVYGLYDPTTKSYIYGDTAIVDLEIKMEKKTYVTGFLNIILDCIRVYSSTEKNGVITYQTIEVDQSGEYCTFTHTYDTNTKKNTVTIQYPKIIYVFNINKQNSYYGKN